MSNFDLDDINQILGQALSQGLNRTTKPSVDITWGITDVTKPNGVKTNVVVTVSYTQPASPAIGIIWLNADNQTPTYKQFSVSNGSYYVPIQSLTSATAYTSSNPSHFPLATVSSGGPLDTPSVAAVKMSGIEIFSGSTGRLRFKSRELAAGSDVGIATVVECERYWSSGPIVPLVYDVQSGTSTARDTVQFANGKYGKLRIAEYVTPLMFGAKGQWIAAQATTPLKTAYLAANLDQTGIQEAVNYAIFNVPGCLVRVPSGSYATTDTIHLGYGVNYQASPYASIRIEGDVGSQAQNTTAGKPGAALFPQFTDRPVFAVSGGRHTKIRNIGATGSETYIISQGLTNPPTVLGANNVSTWIDPTWSTNANSQTAPFCFVAVDPYSVATAPAITYPNVTFPIELAGTGQYAKAASSDTVIEGCFAGGFAVGIAVAPSGNTGQSDFTRVDQCWFQNMIYGVSIGNTDSRVVSVTRSYLNQMHTVITGSINGGQIGQIGSTIENCAFDRCIKWFNVQDVANPRGGPVTIQNVYGENVWSLGEWAGGAARDSSLILNSNSVNFNHTGACGIPPYIIKTNSGYHMITMNGGTYFGYSGAFAILGQAQNFTINGVAFEETTVRTGLFEKIAATALGGAITFTSSGHCGEFRSKYLAYNASTGASYMKRNSDYPLSDSTTPFPIWAKQTVGSGSRQFAQRPVYTPALSQAFTKVSLASISLTNLELTIVFNSRLEMQFALFGPNPGDAIVDIVSGSVFFVHARTGLTVNATLQNNHTGNASSATLINPITLTLSPSEQFLFLNCRSYTPQYPVFGQFTTGSPSVTGVGADDGTSSFLTTEIPTGAFIPMDQYTDNIFALGDSGGSPNSKINTGGGTTLTMNANSLKTERRQIQVLVMAPPANA